MSCATVIAAGARLHRLVAMLRDDAPLSADDRSAIIEGIELRLDGAYETLDEALGLRPKRGQATYESERARAEYKRLVLAWAQAFCTGLNVSEIATKLVGAPRPRKDGDRRGELETYRDSFAWQNRDKFAEACPAKYRGRPQAFYWQMLRIKDHVHAHSWVRNLLAEWPRA